jgi:hypothetical protein
VIKHEEVKFILPNFKPATTTIVLISADGDSVDLLRDAKNKEFKVVVITHGREDAATTALKSIADTAYLWREEVLATCDKCDSVDSDEPSLLAVASNISQPSLASGGKKSYQHPTPTDVHGKEGLGYCVKWCRKGYGFLRCEEPKLGRDVFVRPYLTARHSASYGIAPPYTIL